LLLRVGRGFVIVIVASRMIVAMLADVEVEVEEAGVELTVAVPVARRVEAETANENDDGHAQDRSGQPGTSNHVSSGTPHLGTPR
jgi:hypothetical protein